jgi:outer membrane protein
MEQEQGRVLNDLGNRMVGVIQKYGARAGYTLILDISSPQTPVLYNSNGTDVTPEVVRMFDEVSSPKPDAAPPRPTK